MRFSRPQTLSCSLSVLFDRRAAEIANKLMRKRLGTKKGPYCSAADAKRTKFEGEWDSAAACYDINECELGLDDCHNDAKELFLIFGKNNNLKNSK